MNAYAIATVNVRNNYEGSNVYALIIAPTVEIADQVAEEEYTRCAELLANDTEGYYCYTSLAQPWSYESIAQNDAYLTKGWLTEIARQGFCVC